MQGAAARRDSAIATRFQIEAGADPQQRLGVEVVGLGDVGHGTAVAPCDVP
jgi:hypothetical protein